MPIDPIEAAQAVEKLGIIGVLALGLLLVSYAAWHFRKELVKVHDQLSRARQAFLIVKIAADAAGAKYDLSSIGGLDSLLGSGKQQ